VWLAASGSLPVFVANNKIAQIHESGKHPRLREVELRPEVKEVARRRRLLSILLLRRRRVRRLCNKTSFRFSAIRFFFV
jgi:hypothetical protein